MKATAIYESIIENHPEWRQKFESLFTNFVLCSDILQLTLDQAAEFAADHCGETLGRRRPINQPIDPLEEREKKRYRRPRQRFKHKMCPRVAFYETHDAVIKTFVR